MKTFEEISLEIDNIEKELLIIIYKLCKIRLTNKFGQEDIHMLEEVIKHDKIGWYIWISKQNKPETIKELIDSIYNMHNIPD